MTDVGENRAQELLGQGAGAPIAAGARWHFLGRLQRNKVRALAPWVACWQSVDRAELGDEIARRAPGARVLVEVNLGGEPQKGGCAPGAAPGAWSTTLAGVGPRRRRASWRCRPHDGDPRRWFAALRELGGGARAGGAVDGDERRLRGRGRGGGHDGPGRPGAVRAPTGAGDPA